MPYVGKTPVSGSFKALDDISSSFNGTTTTFNLTSSGVAVFPKNEYNIEVHISSIQQKPITAYSIVNSTIVFTSAPLSTDTFFGKILGDVGTINGVADATIGASSLSSSFFVKNAQTLTGLSLTGSENALLVGTVTISGTIQIPSGSTVVIL
tara:strand:+ start:292 stop:747 length:456 start_codon:yes stop_codon:yes gene_type:complete